MKVTIQDVAKEAGVSITTVSRVINNNYPVSISTREKVEKAIEKLNFNPNLLARSLIHSKTNTIGVIIPSITNLFFPLVVKGIESELREHGYTIYLCDTDNNEEYEIDYTNSLLARQVDGIIAIDPSTKNIKSGFYEKVSQELPLVCINGYSKGIKCNFVLNDEETGAVQAIEHLIKLGHEKIALVRGENSYSYDLKEDIYVEIMKKYNFESNIKIINIGNGNKDETTAMTIAKIMDELQKLKDITAFFTCNDLMALGVINACKKLNLDVPKDISVIGFDNISVASLVEPQITTVDQNMYDLGRRASKLLLENIEKQVNNTQKIVLDTKLIIRESCERAKNTL